MATPHVFPVFISPIQAGFNRKLPIQGEAVGLRPIGDKLNIKAVGVSTSSKKLKSLSIMGKSIIVFS
jgi:hypothetical protein